jgi:hypothetical protein
MTLQLDDSNNCIFNIGNIFEDDQNEDEIEENCDKHEILVNTNDLQPNSDSKYCLNFEQFNSNHTS